MSKNKQQKAAAAAAVNQETVVAGDGVDTVVSTEGQDTVEGSAGADQGVEENVGVDGGPTDAPDTPAVDVATLSETAHVTEIAPVVEQVEEAPVVAPEPAPAPVAPKTKTKANIAASVAGSVFSDAVNNAQTQAAKDQLQALYDYTENMKPRKPVSPMDGARYQVQLYRTIVSIINNNVDPDFTLVFSAMLALFDEHADGVFNETYVFRFASDMALPANDRAAFHRLLNLIKVAAEPAGRAQRLKQVDFEASLRVGVTEAGRQRVLGFFGK